MPTIKKIAFVSDAIYPFNKGGKEKRMHAITRRLAAEGYTVTIYCMQWWSGENTMVHEGVTFRAISSYYPLYTKQRRSIKEAILFALHCFKLLNESFDIMEVDHVPQPRAFYHKNCLSTQEKKTIGHLA